MTKDRTHRVSLGYSFTGTLLLLLVICLADCATGSCLSYGHSCWGAHGKRSGKPAAAPDWILNKLFRRDMDPNIDLNREQQRVSDGTAIYRVEVADDSTNDRLGSDAGVQVRGRQLEGKPMLDEEMISNLKLWQIMREAAANK